MNPGIAYSEVNYLTSLGTVSFSVSTLLQVVIMWVVLAETIIQFCLEHLGKEIFVDGNVTTGTFS
jgi:hypothetical protein